MVDPELVQDKLVRIAIIGGGQRGKAYGRCATICPDKCKVVAVVEPRPNMRDSMVKSHKIPKEMVFHTWEDFVVASARSIDTEPNLESLSGPGRLADAVIVAVQDKMHAPVVHALAEQGYHILCEKPMATSPEECIRMADAVKKSGKIFGIGHVLRYSPYSQTIAKVIESRELGEIVNIVHIEPVRGNWSQESESSFSLMTKSCHDIDIICSYLAPFGAVPIRVSSFGSLSHFNIKNKPPKAGGATKCLECPLQDEGCHYSAKRIYLEPVCGGMTSWPVSVLTDGVPNPNTILAALNNGPYGKCVYERPNDVVDHQVVNLEFSGGQTVSFSMVAFTELICERQTRIHFTKGELIGDMRGRIRTVAFEKMRVYPGMVDRDDDSVQYHHVAVDPSSGHGDGDMGLISAFIDAVVQGKQNRLGVSIDDVLRSHLTVFAAEKSRREGCVVDVQAYEGEIRSRMAKVAIA